MKLFKIVAGRASFYKRPLLNQQRYLKLFHKEKCGSHLEAFGPLFLVSKFGHSRRARREHNAFLHESLKRRLPTHNDDPGHPSEPHVLHFLRVGQLSLISNPSLYAAHMEILKLTFPVSFQFQACDVVGGLAQMTVFFNFHSNKTVPEIN